MSDARTTLVRDGFADARLEGEVAAERFAETTTMQSVADATAVRRAADADAEQMDQLLFGEIFDVLETKDGWAYGRARRDGYVGYVEASALTAETTVISASEITASTGPVRVVEEDVIGVSRRWISTDAEIVFSAC